MKIESERVCQREKEENSMRLAQWYFNVDIVDTMQVIAKHNLLNPLSSIKVD